MEEKKFGKNTPIDLVYTWVDGNDEKWQEEKLKWQKEYGIESGDEVNQCRFVDNEELKYSLRSVAKNAPWINHIYIITNGQVPKWLDVSHPKITIVKHEEIMPKEALPTFNSNAIETCIANIPNLSEYFLYANDDFFIYRPVSPNFFFDKKGKPKTILIKQNWQKADIVNKLYQNNVTYSANLVKERFGIFFQYECHHNIMPYRKSIIKQCKEEFKNEFDIVTHEKFRKLNNLQRTIFSFFGIVRKLSSVNFIKNKKKYNTAIVISLTSPEKIKNNLYKKKPYLFCIEDEEYTVDDARIRLKSCLCEIFPNIQSWEKQDLFQIEPIFPTKKSINIVFCPDNKFCKYFAVALQSLISNSQSDKYYDIVVFEADISSKNKEKVTKMLPGNFNIRYIDIKPFIFENFTNFKMESKKNWSIAMFYRIFIPLLMQKYDRVLYLDSDICINNSISELFKLDIGENHIAVVKDTVPEILYRKPERKDYMENVLNLSNLNSYFNSGMIFFNIRNINMEEYIRDFVSTFKIENLMFPDQDILNILFQNRVKLIHSKWNYLYGECEWGIQYLNYISQDYKKEFLEARENPYIIHYTSPRKPWHRPNAEYADIWWKYARKTPFYEEIIYENTKVSGKASSKAVKYSIQRKRIYLDYLRCKLFSIITFGKKREHYKKKQDLLHERIKIARNFLK